MYSLCLFVCVFFCLFLFVFVFSTPPVGGRGVWFFTALSIYLIRLGDFFLNGWDTHSSCKAERLEGRGPRQHQTITKMENTKTQQRYNFRKQHNIHHNTTQVTYNHAFQFVFVLVLCVRCCFS